MNAKGCKTSIWRRLARPIIAAALAQLPYDATPSMKKKAVLDAYPWGKRAHHPYKMYLKESKAAIEGGLRDVDDVPITEKPRCVFADDARDLMRPFVPIRSIQVDCPWCTVFGGCIVCVPLRNKIAEWSKDETFLSMLQSTRAGDILAIGVFADWLDEQRDVEEIAALFRAEFERLSK